MQHLYVRHKFFSVCRSLFKICLRIFLLVLCLFLLSLSLYIHSALRLMVIIVYLSKYIASHCTLTRVKYNKGIRITTKKEKSIFF